MKDANGTEISVGDYIVFAVVHNRTSRLRWGKVTKINAKTVSAKAYSADRVYSDGYQKFKIFKIGVVEIKSTFSYPELKSQVVKFNSLPDAIKEHILGAE